MNELTYRSKEHGIVTVRPSVTGGYGNIEIWYENNCITCFSFEEFWDFLVGIAGQFKTEGINSLDRGRRFRAALVTEMLAEKLASPDAAIVMLKIREIAEVPKEALE